MEEDDLDFTPISTTSSNLASLFGFNKEPPKGNPSLTYTAPKAPKKESSPLKKQSTKEKSSKILIAKAVQAYKLENGAYVSQGLTGVAINVNQESHSYEIILYKPSKEHLSEATITRNFSLQLSPNNYVSFYDNNKQNWSIMFQFPVHLEQFAQAVAISKFYCESDTLENILTQDLTPSTNPKADMKSTVEIVYSSRSLKSLTVSIIEFEIKEKIKLSNHSFTPLCKGLIGCHEDSKRVIIVPNSLSGPYLDKLRNQADLMLEVKLEKIVTESEVEYLPKSKIFDDGQESSSAEESTIKARGVSIKEALSTTKSQKANLISRMARMGQATLPLKQGPSDSEEEGSLSSSPKPRVPKNRVAGSTSHHQNASSEPQSSQKSESQQLSVYQNDLAWQQSQLAKLGMAYQQQIPVSASPLSSPTTDPSFSVYVSESRVQAAELRMGMCKISEKLDSVWNKLQNLNLQGTEIKTHQLALMDSSGILTSIQSLISENEILKGKVEEQKGKIEQQNDRLFQLLELNHKYLEQSSTSYDKQSESENKLKTEMQYLREKEIQLEAEKKKSEERVGNLEKELALAEDTKKKLNERIEELSGAVEKLKSNLEGNDGAREKEIQCREEKISRASETITNLKEKLKEVVLENENLKSVIRNQKREIETGREEAKESIMIKEKYEKEAEGLRKQISEEESKSDRKIDDLCKVVEGLEEENKRLMCKFEKGIEDIPLKYSSFLKDKFSDSKNYPGALILTTIDRCYEEFTSGSKPSNEKETKATVTESEKVLPAPRTSLQKIDVARKENEDTKSKDADPSTPDSEKNESGNTENDSRYKSYDQGWRTTNPPPPPLFDDDDDDDDWLN